MASQVGCRVMFGVESARFTEKRASPHHREQGKPRQRDQPWEHPGQDQPFPFTTAAPAPASRGDRVCQHFGAALFPPVCHCGCWLSWACGFRGFGILVTGTEPGHSHSSPGAISPPFQVLFPLGMKVAPFHPESARPQPVTSLLGQFPSPLRKRRPKTTDFFQGRIKSHHWEPGAGTGQPAQGPAFPNGLGD